MIKKIAIILLAFCTLFQVCAEELTWITGWPQAQAQAKAEKKMVFLDFTGSDWCPACILFHDEVAMSPEFAAYAKTNLVLVKVDFPRKHPQPEALAQTNAGLLEKFKVVDATGSFPLPTLMLVDSNGKELGRWEGYEPGSGAKTFIVKLDEAKKK